MTTITCETCKVLIVEHEEEAEALEIALYDLEAHYCSESGYYTCEACQDAYYAEGMAMAAAYDSERRMAQMRADDEAWRDEILSNADMAFDLARDRARI